MTHDSRHGNAGAEFNGLPEKPEDRRTDLMVGLAVLHLNEPTYQKARVYYDGRVDEWHADPRIEQILERSARGYPFRFAAVPVDTLAERVRLTSIQVDEDAQDAWNKVYEDNDDESWSAYQHFQTFLYGDTYLRVWPGDSAEDEDASGPEVTHTYLSPLNVAIVYDGINSKKAEFAVHRYTEQSNASLKKPNDTKLRADVYYEDRLTRWITRNAGSSGVDYRDWVPFAAEGEPHEETYDFESVGLPIKHCRTGLVYGRPAHEAAYGPQNAIMKHLITELATVDTQGWPVRMLLADPAAVLDQNNDNPDWDEEDSGTQVPASDPGPVATSFREAPGIVQLLEGIKSVATFEAADPTKLIEPVVKMYLPMIAVTTRTPLYEFFGSMGEEASGKSKAAADGPINKKIDKLQTLFTDFWEQVVKSTLAILEKDSEVIEVGWAPSKMVSDKESWEAISMMLQNGVPFDFVMKTIAGFDPVTVDQWEAPPKPWEQDAMQMEHELKMATAKGVGNTPGKSSDPRGQRGGQTNKSNPTKLGTNPKAQNGPS